MKALKIFLVLIAILGYAVLITYCCVASLKAVDELPIIGEPIIYIVNALCGLVGGIVATAFGVPIPETIRATKSKYYGKMNVLGNLITTGKLSANEKGSTSNKLFGTIYAWVYALIGIAAIVIWAADDVPHQLIKNIAIVSLGLISVVVVNTID